MGSSDGPPRNWRGIGIAMVVILAVMSLVILSVILLTPDESHLLLRSHVTMEDLESEDFKVHDPSVAWLNENEMALRTRDGHILMFSLNNNLTTALLDNSSLDLTTTKFQVSADKRFVLLAYNIRRVFSQSFTASYAIYNVANGDLMEIDPPEGEKAVLQYACWGPQGNQLVNRALSHLPDECAVICISYTCQYNRKSFSTFTVHSNTAYAYVFNGDVYYKPTVTSKPLRLTTTDQEQNVVNGISDWTYEEEVLLTYVAHWWSMDGARLAYLSINNSATPVMEIPHFLGGVYPSNVHFPYPKAGSNIPSVSLFVVNLYGPAHTLEMIPPDSLRARDRYISMVTWISSTRLAVRWLNRAQNQSVLCVCEATTGACSEDVPLFSTDGSLFYTILPAKQGARGEFHHIAGLSAQPAIPSVPPHFLTSGSWDVILLCALDEKAGKMYQILFVLLLSDGVPGGHSVTEEFALDWPQVLSSTHSVALAWVDGRSGVGRGQKTTAVDPRKLSSLRVKDYLAVVELLMQLPYIDDHRMALYGKAFGGYLTLKMLVATDKLFQCAAAVAPITDFRLYTRVHFQHSAELLSRLVKVEANYSLQLYPDEGHILREPRSTQHFQRTMVNYLQNCLKHGVLLDTTEDEVEEDD
ncbi:Inactive dipeptidyl peptidase 10 Dipeptidyl peptidase IV-related protein 3 [Channa argus]|uniref:Inactive dipeptidyl peptidase 10 Dipeptidyl peptidase IV-related protein 3 n=1 Tax=Channa argus TaxID=215402 RepID=A0A6G1Q4B7_CHAAH|nr:Inactive dipeptidyl peptidase 10 Dipeptidyl peptidase IV-related protein 3 [Channa argus]